MSLNRPVEATWMALSSGQRGPNGRSNGSTVALSFRLSLRVGGK